MSTATVEFWGTLLTIIMLTFVFVALPSQVVKNYHEKRCGQPLVSLLVGFTVFPVRLGYALAIGKHHMILPDAIAAVLLAVTITQWFWYRKKRGA